MLEVLHQVSAARRVAGPHSPLYCFAHKARLSDAPLLAPKAEEAEIAAVAQRHVSRVRSHLQAFGNRANTAHTTQELAGTLNGIAVACGARPVAPDVSLSGRIGRMVEPAWWRRNLRRELLRQNEAIEHAQGRIRRKDQCYVSDHAMKVGRIRAKANRATLERLEVANEDGEAFNLAQVADGSVSNPALRRSELMVRCRGFEETAKFMSHEAVLLTITCPSRFHRFNQAGGDNKNWKGATQKDGQKYLNETWKKIRAEWKRKGYAPYGFRVAEPHHDGCPHWHILLFAPADQMGWFVPRRFIADREDHGAGLIGVAGAYAMADSPSESGAVKHRFTSKMIDPAQGGATGYIAKYISKNIDGRKEDGSEMGVDFDSGTGAANGAKRVRTWAQTLGIRQFQQIGGPSVTVWRELRRLGKDLDQPLQLELFEGPRAAADRSLWSLFWVLQGGPEVPRSQLTLKPHYVKEQGGKYGEEIKRVKGVTCHEDGETLVTRLHTWTVQLAGLAEVDAHWARFHGGDRDFYRAYESLSDFEGGEADPWTGVNNCTDSIETDEAAELHADFLRSIHDHMPEIPRRDGLPENQKEFEHAI